MTENQKLKDFKHIFTQLKLSKVYYITHLCEIGLLRKFEFFQLFHFKTTHFFLKSDFFIKNCSSNILYVHVAQKNKGMGRGQSLQILLNRPPIPLLISELH